MRDYLVVGGTSPIGRGLTAALRAQGARVSYTSRKCNSSSERNDEIFLDLESLVGLESLPKARTVVLVAAETRFDVCAQEPERTYQVNVEAPKVIAKRALADGARVLFFSSIAVHDGSIDKPDEHQEPHPNSEYGVQKLRAERELAEIGDVVVIRPSKVITPDFTLFAEWRASLLKGIPITPFGNMLVAPISLDTLIRATLHLLNSQAIGTFQLSACEQINYTQIAQYIARACSVDMGLVRPVKVASDGMRDSKWLPSYARLGCRRFEEELKVFPPRPFEAVDYFLNAELR